MKTDHVYYAYRCKGCRRVITKLQVLEMMSGRTKGRLCPCGSGQIQPTDLAGLDWLLPRVWKLVLFYLLGRLAPPPEPSSVPIGVEPMGPTSA